MAELYTMTTGIKKKLARCHTIVTIMLFCTLLGLFTGSCGYYNPNMLPEDEQGQPVYLYIPLWHNPTNELGLENRIHNSLNDYFIQSKRIILTKDKDKADYLLTGSIDSINFTGRSYTVTDEVTALKAELVVSFQVQENIQESGQQGQELQDQEPEQDEKQEPVRRLILLQRNSMLLEESFTLGASEAENDENKQTALATITDDLGEQIYIRTILSLRRLDKRLKSLKEQEKEQASKELEENASP